MGHILPLETMAILPLTIVLCCSINFFQCTSIQVKALSPHTSITDDFLQKQQIMRHLDHVITFSTYCCCFLLLLLLLWHIISSLKIYDHCGRKVICKSKVMKGKLPLMPPKKKMKLKKTHKMYHQPSRQTLGNQSHQQLAFR